MPAHIRKGLITGAPAYNSGGLGLSIGTRVGGVRVAIARRTHDGGKDSGLEFNIDTGVIYSISTLNGFDFITNIPSNTRKYKILQNKDNVFIISMSLPSFDTYNNSINIMPLSNFVENVTATGFEIRIPSINDTDLTGLTTLDYSGDRVTYILSNTELFKTTADLSQYLDGNTFFIKFNISNNTPIEDAKNMLRNYTGKTYKFELYNNLSGAVTVNSNKYEFNHLGQGACFLSGSKVSLCDGSVRNIEDVQIGDHVVGAFGETNTVIAMKQTIVGDRFMYNINNEHLTTNDHIHITHDRQFVIPEPDAYISRLGKS